MNSTGSHVQNLKLIPGRIYFYEVDATPGCLYIGHYAARDWMEAGQLGLTCLWLSDKMLLIGGIYRTGITIKLETKFDFADNFNFSNNAINKFVQIGRENLPEYFI